MKKSVQFKLSPSDYRQAKKKLKAAHLTWQKLGEQLSQHIILSESLDAFGIPLMEMAPSLRQKAKSAIEGHLETAFWKYIQIKHLPESPNQNHWLAGLQAALKLIIKANTAKTFKRGYLFELEELERLADSMWDDALWLASGHLGIPKSKIDVTQPTLQALFKFGHTPFRLKK